jgi:hypothetical protein
MITKNLARRLERLEHSLLPVLEEPLVIRIISVSPEGERVDSGIEFKVPAVPKPFKKGYAGEGHRQVVAQAPGKTKS